MKKYKIIILDNKENLDQYYSNFINDQDYDVQAITEVAELDNTIYEHEPHLIIADLVYFKNYHEQIYQSAKNKNIPMICASSFKGAGDINLDKNIRILNKPFKNIDLKIAVRSVLAKYYS